MGLSVKTKFEDVEATISARKKSNDGWASLMHMAERKTSSPRLLENDITKSKSKNSSVATESVPHRSKTAWPEARPQSGLQISIVLETSRPKILLCPRGPTSNQT